MVILEFNHHLAPTKVRALLLHKEERKCYTFFMTIQDVENLAELAKIELSPDEKQSLLKDLEEILKYVKVIEGVEVSNAAEEHKLRNVWREDKIKQWDFSRELILKQFPDSQDGFLKVKKIL